MKIFKIIRFITILATLNSASYGMTLGEAVTFSTIVYDGWETPSKPLPTGWTYFIKIPDELHNHGYYAESFIKCRTYDDMNECDVAIANRGTTLSICDYYQDVLVLLEITPDYFYNGKAYLEYIKNSINSDKNIYSASISVTGHSLGALVSELIYPLIDRHIRMNGFAFDSPGAKKIMENLVNAGELPSNALSISEDEMYRIYSAVNAINTTNEQIYKWVERSSIFIADHEDFSNMDLSKVAKPGYQYYFQYYTLNQHKVINFYNQFHDSLFPSLMNTSVVTKRDWPVGFNDSYQYYVNDPDYDLNGYWNSFMTYMWFHSQVIRDLYHEDIYGFKNDFYHLKIDTENNLNREELSKTRTYSEFNINFVGQNLKLQSHYKGNSKLLSVLSKNINGRSKEVVDIYNSATIDKKLYYAVIADDTYLASILIKNGDANVNSVHGNKKYTLLQISIMLGYPDMAKLLIESGADTNIKDNDGNTALHTVSQERYEDSVSYVKILQAGGVNTNTKNNSGETASTIMKKHCPSCYLSLRKEGLL